MVEVEARGDSRGPERNLRFTEGRSKITLELPVTGRTISPVSNTRRHQ
jgi:hypothetical protein